ncbi:MAG: DUF2203 family protein [Myxococcota bacterium]
MSRRWTLEAARAILPDVRRRTAQAVERVEALGERMRAEAPDSEQRRELEQQITRQVSRWLRSMEALGVVVKGAWLVDFDTGSGYLCWRWPEERLEYFHGYDEGFAGRARIQ